MVQTFDPRRVIVLIGLSGSGKSYFAKHLAECCGYAVLRSDVIRKELAGLKPTESAKAAFGGGIYTPQMTEKVYKILLQRAKDIVSKGGKVVLDATFLRRWQRELVFRHFPSAVFVWINEPEEVVIKRLQTRKGDVSDADVSVYRKQKEIFEPPEESLLTFVLHSGEWEKLVSALGLDRI